MNELVPTLFLMKSFGKGSLWVLAVELGVVMPSHMPG